MTYKAQLTEQAKRDLRDIYEYIAFSLLEPGIAKKLKNHFGKCRTGVRFIMKNRGKAGDFAE
jgi:hypothetical protein